MEKLVVDKSSLISVADVIRAKSGSIENLEFPNGFISTIEAISEGNTTEAYESGKQAAYDDFWDAF